MRMLMLVVAVHVPVAMSMAASVSAAGDPGFAETLHQAALEYNRKLEAATQELVDTRARITAEREPIEESRRAAADEVVSLQSAIAKAKSDFARAGTRKKQLQNELETLNRSLTFITSLGRDAVESLNDALLPGEAEAISERLQPLRENLKDPENQQNAALAAVAGELITERLRGAVGGQLAPGSCTRQNNNELVPGTYAWFGPEAFFRAEGQGFVGPVHAREGAPVPVVTPLAQPDAERLEALFRGERGMMLADASGGKAMRLQEVRGTWIDHIQRGGVIGYVIIALGAFALLTTVLKLSDIRLMSVDPPEVIRRVLVVVESGSTSEAAAMVASLSPSLRELFQAGLPYIEKPKGVLEDHLYAALLRQRMRLEQRLPFLTVIVAAAPLLGLLGTVTGMIKTFTLINVFGTGNAAKLSSGISEALVTTEFGLMVAIPTLVVHGYLNRRTQKNLAQMERYAAEFVAVAGERQAFASAEASELP